MRVPSSGHWQNRAVAAINRGRASPCTQLGFPVSGGGGRHLLFQRREEMVDGRYLVEEQLKVWIAGQETLRGRRDIFGAARWHRTSEFLPAGPGCTLSDGGPWGLAGEAASPPTFGCRQAPKLPPHLPCRPAAPTHACQSTCRWLQAATVLGGGLTCSLAGLRGDAGESNTLASVSRPASVKSISLRRRRAGESWHRHLPSLGGDARPP